MKVQLINWRQCELQHIFSAFTCTLVPQGRQNLILKFAQSSQIMFHPAPEFEGRAYKLPGAPPCLC